MYEVTTLENQFKHTVSVRFTDEVDLSQIKNLIDDLVELEEKYPAHKLLVDFGDVEQVKLNFKDIKSAVDYVKTHDTRIGIAALVTGQKLGRYHLAKLYTDMVGVFAGKDNKAFKGKDCAYRWLGIPCSIPLQ